MAALAVDDDTRVLRSSASFKVARERRWRFLSESYQTTTHRPEEEAAGENLVLFASDAAKVPFSRAHLVTNCHKLNPSPFLQSKNGGGEESRTHNVRGSEPQVSGFSLLISASKRLCSGLV